MSSSPFIVDVFGEFRPGEVQILWRDEPRPADARIDALVARTWAEWTQRCRREGRSLYNGQLVRYLRHRAEGGVLTIEAGPSDYMNFIGTNYANPCRGDELGWHLYSNPLGISGNVISSDGWLLYGRRNQRVACHPGYVHAFGGAVEAEDRLPNGHFDPFDSLRRELREELHLQDGEIGELICLGMIRDSLIRQPEMVFDVYVSLCRDELASRIADDDDEHVGIEACRDAAESILPFVRSLDLIAPISIAAICVHGRRLFGPAWYEQAVAELSQSRGDAV